MPLSPFISSWEMTITPFSSCSRCIRVAQDFCVATHRSGSGCSPSSTGAAEPPSCYTLCADVGAVRAGGAAGALVLPGARLERALVARHAAAGATAAAARVWIDGRVVSVWRPWSESGGGLRRLRELYAPGGGVGGSLQSRGFSSDLARGTLTCKGARGCIRSPLHLDQPLSLFESFLQARSTR